MQQIEKEYCHSIRSCDTIIMNLICRTCMQNHKQYVSIFDYHQNGKMLSDMLVECATIKIQKDDGLPTYICNYCLERLTSTWDFRAMIIKTDSDLRNILEKSKTENVLQNSNLFTDATVVKEESVIFNSEITSSLIQKNVITNNSNREECSQELITSSNDNNLATFSEHKTKGEIDKLLLKNNLDKSSHNLANEDNTISETSIKRVANNCTKRKRITSKHGQQIENEMNIDRKVKRSITSKLLSPGDSNDTENLESKKRENKNTKYIQEIEKHVTEEQDIIQDSCNINNTITCEDEDKIMLEDNSQCHSDDESINNFDISNENVAETQLNSENVYKNFTRTEREKMSVFCKTCNRSFGYRYYFEVHVKLHSGDKKCKCDICGQSFVRQFQLRLHMTKHSDERPYSCETCGKTFKTYGAVYSHRAVHSDGTLFTCDICQKSFKSSSALKGHIRRHTSEKKYTCEVCGKSFSDSGCFSKHKLIHVDEKKFSCQTCGKTFSTKPGMRRHLRLHTAARRHACSYCDKSFKTKDVLDAHILIHTGEKPYSCKVCDKSFRQSAALFNHMRIHTGETPYACEHCPSQFKYSHHLQNHMKVHK